MNLRILSWNVLADAYLSYGDYSGADPFLLVRGARTSQILEVATSYGADVIALQEADIALASAAMGALALLAFYGTGAFFPESDILGRHFRLGLAILIGFASLFPPYRIFRVHEAKEVYRLASLLLRKVR